ncbi:LptE family protein [Chryseobacterium oryzae]|uniref:LPS assembly lipoprotein LptE n=1 Tax=Chryseobacterium oryzae TaxID=2929799 RepID=A0ABY4BH80_9FLAO|nr:LptE family protein [Chryseobacterium oryzae]UOE38099.1 LPS assembly lipoprotein LptE [Chryseobacterium oryzae]
MNTLKNLLILMVSVGFLNSCYTFTGSSLKDEKTVQINEFPNNAALVNPALSQQFSTDIQNRFLQRTTLKGTKTNPDILIEGEITDYGITPTTISSSTQQTSAGTIQQSQNKLTITVKVRYENKLHSELSFERTYVDEAVFNSNLSQSQIETSQVKLVTDRIINKIFNDIVANW